MTSDSRIRAALAGPSYLQNASIGKIMLIDIDKCTGCKACVVACSMRRDGFSSAEQSRIHLTKDENRCFSIPIVCEHCKNPPCAKVCPVNAISKDASGIVLLDVSKCTGCKRCTWICPWGEETIDIRRIPDLRGSLKGFKCDLCGGDPQCAKVCIHGCLTWTAADEKAIERKWSLAEKRAHYITSIKVAECYRQQE